MEIAIGKIVELGFTAEEATEMVEQFTANGGLSCVLRWPEDFSMFAATRNVLDVLLECGMF